MLRSPNNTDSAKSFVKSGLLFLIIFVIVLSGHLFYWFAFFPGGFNLDAYGQWSQVHGNQQLNNWHPVFVTGIYWLLTRIVDRFWFCILFQIVLFSVSISCLLVKIGKLIMRPGIMIVIALFEAINPAITINNICLVKDVYFTIWVIWIAYILVELCAVKTDISKIPKKLGVPLGLFSVAMLLTRYNAIFYVLPLFILIWICWKGCRKDIFKIAIVVLIINLLISGPVYKLIGVRPHDNPTGEIVGMPMAMMVNALLTDPENIPEDVESFLLEIANRDEYEELYITGEWDSVKWKVGGTELLKNESLSRILWLSLKTFMSCPRASISSIAWNTRIVWQVFGIVEWDSKAYLEDNEYGIYSMPNEHLRDIADDILKYGNTEIGGTIVWNLGGYMIFLAWSIYYLLCERSRKIALFVPIVSYVVLTMFLLSGPNYRYFYFLPVLVVPLGVFNLMSAKVEGK